MFHTEEAVHPRPCVTSGCSGEAPGMGFSVCPSCRQELASQWRKATLQRRAHQVVVPSNQKESV